MDIRKVCPTCGALVNASDAFCSSCGTKFDAGSTNGPATDDDGSCTQIIDDEDTAIRIQDEDSSTQIYEEDSDTHILDDDAATMTTDDTVHAEARQSAENAFLPGEDLDSENETMFVGPETHMVRKRSVWIWLGPVLAALLLGAGAVYWFGFRTSETLGGTENVEDESDSEDEDNTVDDVTVIEERSTAQDVATPDLAFSDLHGRVRKCVSPNGSTEFDALGNMTTNEFQKVKRNGEGYIVAADVDDGEGGTATFEYQLDSRKRYVGFILNLPNGEIRQARIKYSPDGTISEMIVTNNYDQRLEFEYTDYEFDNRHNWTSRKIKRTAYYNDEYGNQQQNSDEASEVRTISYYE